MGLIIERPGYGYDLAERYERTFPMLRLSSPSYIYVSLEALIERGFVEELPSSGGGRQPRLHYRATTDGVRAYQEQLISELGEDRGRSQLFARKLAVLARQPELALEVIGRDRRACLEQATKRPLSSARAKEPAGVAPGLAARLSAEGERLALDAKIDWLDYAKRELTALFESRSKSSNT